MNASLSILALAVLALLAAVWVRGRRNAGGGVRIRGDATAWLDSLEGNGFRVFHDLRLPAADGRGPVRVDHVAVGEHGIFVIETNGCAGVVSGCRYDRSWTRAAGGRVRRFRNPLQRNERRAKALAAWLGLPEMCFKGVVFFTGSPRFETAMPENVVSADHLGWLKARKVCELLPAERERAVSRLQRRCQDAAERGPERRDAAGEAMAAVTACRA